MPRYHSFLNFFYYYGKSKLLERKTQIVSAHEVSILEKHHN